jgi:hypothetical protein
VDKLFGAAAVVLFYLLGRNLFPQEIIVYGEKERSAPVWPAMLRWILIFGFLTAAVTFVIGWLANWPISDFTIWWAGQMLAFVIGYIRTRRQMSTVN